MLQKNLAFASSLLLLFAFAVLDLETGYNLGFFVFYFIPISIVSWYCGRTPAVFFSFIAAVAWLIVDRMSGHPYSNWAFPYWNAFIRYTSFIILAFSLSQIQILFAKEKKLKQELSDALERIKQYISIAEKVAQGDLPESLPGFNEKGKSQLDKSFNLMIKRLLEQKNLENRLSQLERKAIMAETASYLAHEIRNPLNLIMLTAHHIGHQFTPNEESPRKKFSELIASLKSEVEQLSKVVSNFMAIGKPSEMHKVNVSISVIIDQVLLLIRQQLTSRNITLELTGVNNLEIFADPEQLRLVFLNLFVNAIAAIPDKGQIWVRMEPDRLNNNVRFSISDNGPGIKVDDIENIFEPYFTSRIDGTGLGLALVKRIVEEHNGIIRAENRLEGGACFEILLPIKEQ